MAAHQQFGYFGDKSGEPFTNPEIFDSSPELAVYGQTYVSHRPAVNADNIKQIVAIANKSQQQINVLLAPIAGLSDMQNIIYTYVNQRSKDKKLDSIDSPDFFDWLKTSKVSPGKQQKIAQHPESKTMGDLFFLVRELMKAKNEVIAELDTAEGDITSTTGGKPGGEGYVSGDDSVKLVPRDRWTPFRAD